MNSELQAQTDVLVRAITQLEDTLHHDLMLLGLTLAVLIVMTSALVVVLSRRRP